MTQADGDEANDPLAPTPGRWTRPAKSFSRWHAASLGMVALGAIVALIGMASSWFPLAGIGLATVVVCGLGTVGLERLPFFDAARDFRLENPDDLDVCLVDLTITHGESWVGRDRGAAWFEEGRLCYSGARTSFAVGGQDVVPPDAPERRIDPFNRNSLLEAVPCEGMTLRTAPPVYVALTPVVQIEGGKSFERKVRFNARLRAFREERPISHGPRQFPPLAP